MVQWLCLGWVLGIALMGREIGPYSISAFFAIFVFLIWLVLSRFILKSLNSYLTRFSCAIVSFLIGGLLGQGYAHQSLDQRLQQVQQHQVEQTIIVYIERLNILSPHTIQQSLTVLQPNAQTVQWMGMQTLEQSSNNPTFSLELGKYYRLSGQVRPAHSYATPGSFDVEKWYLQQNVMAGFRIHQIEALSEQQLYTMGHSRHLSKHQGWWHQFGLGIEKQRLALREFIAKQPVQNKGLILALLTGDESLLAKETGALFQRFGMSHLLAISGPHVVIFALMFCAFLQFVVSKRMPQLYLIIPRQYFLCIPFLTCVLLYCAFVGFEIPAMRTMLSCSVVCICILLKLQIQPFKLLLISASLLLWVDPFSILSAAFWLSYGACFVLLRIYQTIQRIPRDQIQTRAQKIITLLKALIESQWKIFLALLPLMVIFFKQVAWITPLSNLVAIPWMGLVVVPLDILAALSFFIFEPFASLLFQINDLCLGLLLEFLQLLDRLFSPQLIYVAMTPWMIGSLILVLIVLFLPRGTVPKPWAMFGIFPIIFPNYSHEDFELNVLDVGQGQAIFIRDGVEHMMVDVGGYYDESRFSVGQQIILPYLSIQGVSKLDRVVLTHLDRDHSGAFQSIQSRIPISTLNANADVAEHHALNFEKCNQGLVWNLGKRVTIQVLSPSQATLNPQFQNKNESSCVLYMEVREKSDENPKTFLLMGDAGWETEYRIMQNYPNLKADVLILGHHGSHHSSSYGFLQHIQPTLAVVSAGRFNRYQHPSPTTLARLEALNISIFNTATHGTIGFQIKNGVIKQNHHRETRRWLNRSNFLD